MAGQINIDDLIAKRAPSVEEKKKEENEELVPVIEISGLTQIFNQGQPSEYRLFDNFNLTIPDFPGKGQLISIMGGSGCGKSRLLYILSGLAKAQKGDIRIYGQPLQDYPKAMPMVFQSYVNYEYMTLKENVMLAMEGLSKKEAERKALELLKLVGLEGMEDKYAKIGSLSGGQLQRVSIATCLASKAQIILFDEATGALDIKMKREIQNLMLDIFYDSPFDPTILNVTHSIEEAIYVSNRIIILKPEPCTVWDTIDIEFPCDREGKRRTEAILSSPEFLAYTQRVTQAMGEVCK